MILSAHAASHKVSSRLVASLALLCAFMAMNWLAAPGAHAQAPKKLSDAEACEQGDLRACVWRGKRLQETGEERDVRAAAELFKKACRGKVDAGCLAYAELFNAFVMTYDDLSVRFDTEAGMQRFLSAQCKGGVGGACFALAEQVETDPDMETQYRNWIENACSAGYQPGCKVQQDWKREEAQSRAVTEKIRQRKRPCIVDVNALGPEEKQKHARKAYDLAGGYFSSAAIPTFEPEETEADLADGVTCLQIAANLGSIEAQFELGRILYHGRRGNEVDQTEGNRLLNLAAARGSADASAELDAIAQAKVLAAKNSAAAQAEARKAQARLDSGVAITKLLEDVIRIDSRYWVYNRYDRNSMRGGRILAEQGDIVVVHGDYTYNEGLRGWIRARFRGETLECIEIWDFQGTCRPLRENPSLALVGGMMGALMSAPAPSSSQADADGFAAQKQREADFEKYSKPK